MTNDKGAAVNYDASIHDRYYSIGPEINYFYEPTKTFFSLRYQKELGVVDRTDGHNIVFSFVTVW